MKVFTYAIYSASADIIYVGISKDVSQRLAEHNSGKAKFTKSFRPWIVFYSEEFASYSEARSREKQLKASSGKSFLREKLNAFRQRAE